jgi:hypothetical protein
MRLITLCLLCALASTASAQAPSKCAAPEHRQFDFWVGTWQVTENGKPAGRNRIEAIDAGCALLETWEGVEGLTGHSLNLYDAKRGRWHQTWVDSRGALLILEGSFRNGSMVLEGAHEDPKRRERITWTPLPGGDVRQHWETTTDGGSTWATAFDGRYARSGDLR